MVTIEPIKNQYLTALKERQQIIDKLNEIISGLNALNFDDLTTIQAELVTIRESLQTQNTAITEINNSIGQIESELTSFENNTTLNLQSKVNKNGDTMTGNLGIPTTTTGVRDNLAVNGERLQNDLDNYAPMLRTSGNQTITGEKQFLNNLFSDSFIINRTHDSRVPSANKVFQIEVDSNDGYTHYIAFNNGVDGSRSVNIVMYVSETDVCYFNLTYTAQGEKKIFTNFPKPDGW